jgi:predicted nucleic acid-binding protein
MATRLVVADTGPLNYLVLIEAVGVLSELFEQVLIPASVYKELGHADAPGSVRALQNTSRFGLRCVLIRKSRVTT